MVINTNTTGRRVSGLSLGIASIDNAAAEVKRSFSYRGQRTDKDKPASMTPSGSRWRSVIESSSRENHATESGSRGHRATEPYSKWRSAIEPDPRERCAPKLDSKRRHTTEPDPGLAKCRERIMILAVTFVILMALAMTYLAVTMINTEQRDHEAKAQQATQMATQMSRTTEQLVFLSDETVISISDANTDAGTSIATDLTETDGAVPDATGLDNVSIGVPTPDAAEPPAVEIDLTTLSLEQLLELAADPEFDLEPLLESILPLSDRQRMAKVLYEEADCVISTAERSMVVWVFFNRYDSGVAWFGGTFERILTKPKQFAWNPNSPVTERNLALVNDVCLRWYREHQGDTDVGRTLPDYVYYFSADSGSHGWHNRFYWTDQPLSGEKHLLDYNQPLANPYDS